ncbi:MAG: 2-oxoacid:ferredoxin oxidoreductase subunit gamma [Deltaproteobacteria bacterium]|nr:2-oxoacid:ferredoxin oxidoreductase subunit gamma [Deltaproteobacteria bacterium]
MITKTAFAGSGGQGVLSMGYILAYAAMRDKKNVTYLPSYGAEVRGGTANCTVCISDEEIASPIASAPDFAIVLNKPSMIKYQEMIRKGGIMLVNSSLVDAKAETEGIEVVYVPASKLALELGSERAVNMIMLGAFAAKTGVTSIESLIGGMSEVLKSKNAGLVDLNKKAVERGAEYVLSGR